LLKQITPDGLRFVACVADRQINEVLNWSYDVFVILPGENSIERRELIWVQKPPEINYETDLRSQGKLVMIGL
jgi:hypothetical protein